MSRIIWDQVGERTYEIGVKNGVLYIPSGGVYAKGVAWNGLTAVSEKPSGAEASPQYADDIKYLNLVSSEQFGATIEAFTYPDEFAACDGSVEIKPGVKIGQQARKTFGLSYRTVIGNDVDGTDYGYKLHLVYGALAAPSEKGYKTVNDQPEAISFSWEITTTPVSVKGFKPSASVVIDSTIVTPAKMEQLENILYGTDSVEPRLPLPDEIAAILDEPTPSALTVTVDPADETAGVIVSDNITLTFDNKISKESVILISATGSIISVTKTWDSTGKILTLNPVADLSANTTYLINIIGVIDIYGQL